MKICLFPLILFSVFVANGQKPSFKQVIPSILEKNDSAPYQMNRAQLDNLDKPIVPTVGSLGKKDWPVGWYLPTSSNSLPVKVSYIDEGICTSKIKLLMDTLTQLRFNRNTKKLSVFTIDVSKAYRFYLYQELYKQSKDTLKKLTPKRKDDLEKDAANLIQSLNQIIPKPNVNNLCSLKKATDLIKKFYEGASGKFLNHLAQTDLVTYSPLLSETKSFSLNPIGFTEEKYLNLDLSDSSKAALFDTLVNYQIRRIRNRRGDSLSIKILKEWIVAQGTGKQQFKLIEEIDKKKKQNKMLQGEFINFKKFENLIAFHSRDCEKGEIFDLNFEEVNPDKKAEKIPDIDRRDDRVYYVHNVPKRSLLLASFIPNEIKNQSAFEYALEKATAEVTSELLTDAGTMVSKLGLTTITHLVGNEILVNSSLMIPPHAKIHATNGYNKNQKAKTSFNKVDLVLDDLKRKFKTECLYDSISFMTLKRSIKAKLDDTSSEKKDTAIIQKEVDKYQETQTKMPLDEYNGFLEMFKFQATLIEGTIPPDPATWKPDSLSTAKRTEILKTPLKDKPQEFEISLMAKDNIGDSTYIARYQYKTGERIRFTFSIGFSLAQQDYYLTSVDQTGGNTSLKSKQQDKLKLMIALHFYPFYGGMLPVASYSCDYSTSNLKLAISRISFLGGVGSIDAPLNNLYLGVSYDVVPGLKVSTGPMWFKDKKYELKNNQVVSEKPYFKSIWYIGITLSPTIAKSILKIF